MLARNPEATWTWSPQSHPEVRLELGAISAALENRIMAGCMERGRFNEDRLLNYTGELLAEGLRRCLAGIDGVPKGLAGAALEPYIPMQVRASAAYAVFNGAQLSEQESD